MPGARLLFGAGGFGTTEKSFTFAWDTPEKISEMLDIIKDQGINQLDSAAGYPPGNPWNAETLLGQAKGKDDFLIDTKIITRPLEGSLTAENIDASFSKSLSLLGVQKLNTLYAHWADPATPIAETAEGFQAQYAKGRFTHLGFCNWTQEQVKEYIRIADEKGYVKPTVIQDQYNVVHRHAEKYFSFLRQNGISFYAYSPLAGGLLTGKVTLAREDPSQPLRARSRWEGESAHPLYGPVFDQGHVHAAIRRFRDVCVKHGLSETEVSLRWLAHHSLLEKADGIILGATKAEQLTGNVEMIRHGALPAELVEAADTLWKEADIPQ